MRAEQLTWSGESGWVGSGAAPGQADLVIYFGTRQSLGCGTRYQELKSMFPDAHIMGCSTGGQIHNDDVTDDIAALAVKFDNTKIRLATQTIAGAQDSKICGQAIGRSLGALDLAGMFVLCDGMNVNGSALVAGITDVIGHGIPVTGGMAGDGADFKQTIVGGDSEPVSNFVAAVGFYGKSIHIGHGSAGGWDVFGPRRRITQSEGNVLFELDGEPALDLYKRYLGEEADGLPGSALLFPLRISDPDRSGHEVVRTVLAVDHQQRTMTFAGDVPQGWSAQLMRGTFDRLAAGAAEAARQAHEVAVAKSGPGASNGVAILVSCIGRRLMLGQRTADEVESAGSELAPGTLRVGFYSYGEISPHAASGVCELHNQTMTVTTLNEVAG